jgi:tRNA 2-thiouridine synthesizing protein B
MATTTNGSSGIILHLVTRSPFASTALEDALRCSAQADGILLMHDAVIAAPTAVALPQHLAARFSTRRLFVLGPDLAARGMGLMKLRGGIQVVDDAAFLGLACAHHSSLTWS